MNFLKNYLLSLLTQVINIIIPFITLPIVARALGQDGIGKIAVVNSVIQYFLILGSTGLMSYGNKTIAYVSNDKEKLTENFFQMALLQISLSVISVVLYITYVNLWGGEIKDILWVAILQIIATLFDFTWFFYGISEFKIPTLRNFFLKLVGLIAIYLLVKTNKDIHTYLYIIGITNCVSNISVLFYLKKHLNLKKITSVFFSFGKHIMPAVVLIIPFFIMTMYTNIDRLIINKYVHDFKEVGIYDVGMKFIMIFAVLVVSLRPIMISKIASSLSNEDSNNKIPELVYKSLSLVVYVSIPVCILVFENASVFIGLFLGKAFQGSSLIIKVLTLQILFTGIGDVLVNQILIAMGKERRVMIVMIVLCITLITSYFVFIPLLGIIGAAMSSMLSHFLILFLEFYFVKQCIKLKFNFTELFKNIIGGVALFGVMYCCFSLFNIKGLVGLVIVSTLGMATYVTSLALLRFDLQENMFAMIWKILKGFSIFKPKP